MKSLRFLFSLVFVLFTNAWVLSQHPIQVASQENFEPIPFAKVLVIHKNEVIYKTTTSDRGIFYISDSIVRYKSPFQIQIKAYGFDFFEDTFHLKTPKQCLLNPLVKAIDEVVVTGQLSQTNSEQSVHRIRVLDAKTIEAKGAVNLRDLLQTEMGIRISQDQILGSGLSLQGMSSENIKILIDGVPIIGRLDGNIDLSQINLSNIERIELVEGPLSVNYGSNALGGTINLITKKTTRPGKTIQLNSYYETVGNYNLDGNFSLSSKKHNLSINAGRNYFDGWSMGDPKIEFPKKRIADSLRFHSWKPKEQLFGGLQYTYRWKRTVITPFADWFWEKVSNRGLPRPPFYGTAFDDYYTTTRNNQGVHFTSFMQEKYKIQGVVTHNYFYRTKNTFITDLYTLNQQLTPNESDQDTSIFRAFMSRATFSKSRNEHKLNYEIGYDVNYEIGEGKRISENKRAIGDYALFSTAEWKIHKSTVLKPGVRAAYNSAYQFSVVPSLQWKMTYKKSTFRFSYANGFRAPSMKELYLEFVDINHNIIGNTSLKPEKSHHFQTWCTLKRTLPKADHSLEANAFYQHVNDKISLSQDVSGLIYSYFNLNTFVSTGLQFKNTIQRKRTQVSLGLNYVGMRSNLSINNFSFSPEIVTSISYTIPKIEVLFTGFYKYTGKVLSVLKVSDTEFQEFRLNDYHLLDFSFQKKWWKNRIVTQVGGKNMLNVTNILSSGSLGGAHSGGGNSSPIVWGRSFYIKLSLNFK
jgi:outer membrane receptor for ferrienterochelin and colicins